MFFLPFKSPPLFIPKTRAQFCFYTDQENTFSLQQRSHNLFTLTKRQAQDVVFGEARRALREQALPPLPARSTANGLASHQAGERGAEGATLLQGWAGPSEPGAKRQQLQLSPR